ncbi:MAG: hypothetical protein RLZZ450_931 [Pseudomonadota bacterium]
MALAFDRVVIETPAGTVSLSTNEFAALPLTERLRAIFEKRLRFYRGSDAVDVTLALTSLREVALTGKKRS